MDNLDSRQEINKYKKFKKVDGAAYRKVNAFLRKRTYITAREWALARLCTDFRTSGGAEMTFIGQHLPELVPFMEDTYTPQAVNQARNAFKKKVRKSSATFFYGAMCGFFTTDELDDLLFEASEVARFLLEVEGTTLDIDEEIDIEDRITKVMRGVGEAAKTLLKNRGEESRSQDTPEGSVVKAIAAGGEGQPGESGNPPEGTMADDSKTSPAFFPTPSDPAAESEVHDTERENSHEVPVFNKSGDMSDLERQDTGTTRYSADMNNPEPQTDKNIPSGENVPEKDDA
ncbi:MULTISPECIES: DUF5806 family protein [unclassified Methanoregula]|uniref:DUF5806 family protein n=1 Tax=unclassified Methanoregula TaxID=2649730 RepID=UPI0009C9B024|nr:MULTISPECIES: DUF5806 family protein [unclassified Methanoregula]OPX61912.1 MAG: hypothetical protein A4E33_02509 [Methanoregula sp. PtaB.Bin085]OPY34414.1 MAG: hypothetical protein A4E34_01459 [Methanoregula sp. PtaU1.Bin006]